MGLNFSGFFLLVFNKTCMWSFAWNLFVFRGKKATVSKMYCNMLCSCFISAPVHMNAFSLSLTLALSLPRKIPAVIPSTQCNKLPIRLCCTFQRQICATAPPLLHQLLGTVSLPCREPSPASERHGNTQGHSKSYQRTKRSKLLKQDRSLLVLKQHCWSSKSTASFQLVLPSCHTPVHVFFFFHSIRWFSSPVEHSSRLSLVHTVPLSHE